MKYWIRVWACFLVVSGAWAADTEEKVTGPTAAVAWFTDAPIDSSVTMSSPMRGLRTVPGAFGQGVFVDRAVPIPCPVLIQARGYISFWIKPNWNGRDGQRHRILRIGDPETNGLLVEKSEQGLLRFVMASSRRVTAARADVSNWRAGEWHHVVVTWKDFRGKPLGLPIWIDHWIADGPVAADNDFLDPTAMDDARLWLGDATTNAVIDELIVRNRFEDALSERQIDLVHRDYFRTAPYEAIRIDPEPLRVPADRRVVVGQPKQFGLEGQINGVFEDLTDFVQRHRNWGHFDAKPLIQWSTSNSRIAVVDENGLVTGKSIGRCTLVAEFRGVKASYALEVIPIEQPDLDLAWVERLPRYDVNAPKTDPAPGDTVRSVAHIFNMGYKPVPAGAVVTFELFAESNGNYALDPPEARQRLIGQMQTLGPLAPKEEVVVTFEWTWPQEPVWVRVTVDPRNRIGEICEANNQLCDLNTARPALWAHEPDEVNKFYDERTILMTGSFSVYDSNQAHIHRLNCLLREAVYPSTSPHGIDYAVRLDHNIWRGDFLAGDPWGPYVDRKKEEQYDFKWWRGNWPHDPIKTPLALNGTVMHEIGHTILALPDLYGSPVDEHRCYLRDENGEFYEGGELLPYVARHNIISRARIGGFVPCDEGYAALMDACNMWLAEENAAKIQAYTHIADRPFWGSQGPLVPGWRNWITVHDVNDRPLVGAAVYVYHVAQPGYPFHGAQYFYDRPKFVGHTDEHGRFFFPKETDRRWDDPNTDEVEGRIDVWNPFGTALNPVAPTPHCYGYAGMFLIKLVAGDLTEFHYVSLGQFNIAFLKSHAEGGYLVRTSLKPVSRETPIVYPKVPGAIRQMNRRPVAVVAQRALTARVDEAVTLDGSESYDPEGQPLVHYEWHWRAGECDPYRQAGAVITVTPKKPGLVKYALFVNDGIRTSKLTEVTITVLDGDTDATASASAE